MKRKAWFAVVTSFSFVYGLISLSIGGLLAVIITPLKIAHRMSDDMAKKLW